MGNTEQQLLDMLANPAQREQGYRQLMQQYGKMLYWHIRRVVVDHHEAQDVMQETAIKVLENFDKFKVIVSYQPGFTALPPTRH